MARNRSLSAGSAQWCEEADAQDGGPSSHHKPSGGTSKREQEREEERRRSNAGVSKWPPGEEESTESREEEITQPVLFSHPLPRQVERLTHTETCLLVNLQPAGANSPGKPAHPTNRCVFSHMTLKKP